MHELSIALSLVEIACEEVARLGDPPVAALHLRVGPLSGVVTDALQFSFALATENTAIHGASLVVEEAPLIAHCDACNVDREIASVQRLRCPVCDTPTPTIVQGRELELIGLELAESREDAHEAANR